MLCDVRAKNTAQQLELCLGDTKVSRLELPKGKVDVALRDGKRVVCEGRLFLKSTLWPRLRAQSTGVWRIKPHCVGASCSSWEPGRKNWPNATRRVNSAEPVHRRETR